MVHRQFELKMTDADVKKFCEDNPENEQALRRLLPEAFIPEEDPDEIKPGTIINVLGWRYVVGITHHDESKPYNPYKGIYLVKIGNGAIYKMYGSIKRENPITKKDIHKLLFENNLKLKDAPTNFTVESNPYNIQVGFETPIEIPVIMHPHDNYEVKSENKSPLQKGIEQQERDSAYYESQANQGLAEKMRLEMTLLKPGTKIDFTTEKGRRITGMVYYNTAGVNNWAVKFDTPLLTFTYNDSHLPLKKVVKYVENQTQDRVVNVETRETVEEKPAQEIAHGEYLLVEQNGGKWLYQAHAGSYDQFYLFPLTETDFGLHTFWIRSTSNAGTTVNLETVKMKFTGAKLTIMQSRYLKLRDINFGDFDFNLTIQPKYKSK